MAHTRLWPFEFKGPLCWEQLNHTKDNKPSNSKKLGWVPNEKCQCIIILKDSNWYRLDQMTRDILGCT